MTSKWPGAFAMCAAGVALGSLIGTGLMSRYGAQAQHTKPADRMAIQITFADGRPAVKP